MLSNILFTLAIIWLTFAIASILVGMYYTYTVVLPWLIDWTSSEEIPKGWDSIENADQSQLTTTVYDNPIVDSFKQGYREPTQEEDDLPW